MRLRRAVGSILRVNRTTMSALTSLLVTGTAAYRRAVADGIAENFETLAVSDLHAAGTGIRSLADCEAAIAGD